MSRIDLDRMAIDSSGALGPGVRAILWFHGCNRNCPGCVARDWNARPEPNMRLSVDLVANMILHTPELEGVTISGGEPFLQAEALLALLRALRSQADIGVILYTGFTRAELPQGISEEILAETDVLIDGAYREDLNDGKPFRGSSNQTVYQLTSRYTAYYQDPSIKRSSSIRAHDGQYTLTGIPDKNTLAFWQHLKERR